MALQKQQVNLDLISGTETKINNQINDKNQDMVNVVFTGDMTAKKMNGYDLIDTLPANEFYSSLFTRNNELLAQTEKGTYKYFENIQKFKKIDEIGSSTVDSTTSYGDLFCAGQVYDMWVAVGNSGQGVTATQFLTITFTDKQGNVINSINQVTRIGSTGTGDAQVDYFKFIQAVSQTIFLTSPTRQFETFYLLSPNGSGILQIGYYQYDPTSNSFLNLNNDPTVYKISSINTFDAYADSSDNTGTGDAGIYFAVDYKGSISPTIAAQTSIVSYKPLSGFSTTAINLGSHGISGGIQISKRNVSSVYVSFGSASYVGAYSGSAYDLVQGIYNLTVNPSAPNTIAFSSNSIVYTLYANSTVMSFVNYPTSDTTSVFMAYMPVKNTANGFTFNTDFWYSNSVFTGNTGAVGNFGVIGNTGAGNLISIAKIKPGLTPVSEIFVENGEYYIHCVQQMGLKLINFIIKVSTGTPIATFDSTKGIQVGLKNGQNALYGIDNPDTWSLNVLDRGFNISNWYTLHKPKKYNNSWAFCTREFRTSALLRRTRYFTVNFNAVSNNAQIEINKKSHIFNGQPAYYDGTDLSELGFNQAPTILATSATGSGGTLPAATTYQLVAVYRWKDVDGNIFYSDLSNIAGLSTNITVTSGQNIVSTIGIPMVSTKSNIELLLYIKKDADQFRLGASAIIDQTGTAISSYDSISLTISSYVTSGAEYLYATSTFTAGGDYPTSALTDTLASAIYEDRFFVISRDNPISVAYSQKKMEGYGDEFNQDIFYLDIYDKRGINEDKLSGLIAMDGRLFIFKERSILYIVGSGPTRANTQDDLSSPQLVTTDVGCISAKSLVLVPDGIMFMSDKGIYLLNRKLQVSYIGSNVERFNSNTVTSAILLEKVNEVRFTTLEGQILVYNYFSNAWSWFTDLHAVSACIWKGVYTLLLTDGRVFLESFTHKKIVQNGTPSAIIQKISSPWVKVNERQSWEKVYETLLIGTYKSEHQVKVSFYYDYENYASDVYVLNPLPSSSYNINTRPLNSEIESGAKTDGVYQLLIDMVRKNCQAFRMVIEDIPLNISSNTGESFALSNIAVTFGIKKGPAKIPAVKTY